MTMQYLKKLPMEDALKILDDKPVLIVLVAILLLVLHALLPMKVVAILHILEEERVMVVGEQVK